MRELAYTLMTDGSSDKALLPVMDWLLQQHLPAHSLQSKWADLRRLPRSQQASLEKKIADSLRLYPCDLLFIHRDAEKQSRQKRKDEILKAYLKAEKLLKDESIKIPEYVCVVPVRMLETWLLFDEAALRKAAGNPAGRQTIQLPSLRRLESEPKPKSKLHELLIEASGLNKHRRKRFNVEPCVHRLASCIKDFTPLRQLTAFQALETDVIGTLTKLGFSGK